MTHWRRPVVFAAVGTVAAAVHWAVAVLAVEQAGVAPAWANPCGWLVALLVSFTGHWRLTFRDRQVHPLRSALRFVALSATAFAVNAAAYGLMLRWGAVRYDVGLAIVLLLVAMLSYLASHHWAFAGD
jgi:putative flippase GtrA